MPRKALIRTGSFPYHVTARCNNREPFFIPLSEVWDVFNEHLSGIEDFFEVQIHAFVVMPNHFHLMLTVPKEDLGIVMREFIRSVTKTINRNAGRSGRVFGARYHWSLTTDTHYFDCAIKYIYRNPVKAGLCESVESYSFSSLGMALGWARTRFRICPLPGELNIIPSNQKIEYLEWLNKPFSVELDEALQMGFKKTKFLTSKEKKRIRHLKELGFATTSLKSIQK